MLDACQQIVNAHGQDAPALLDVAVLLSGFGYLSGARVCLERACRLQPEDLRSAMNLANLAREAGDHAESRRLHTALLERLPNHPAMRRNALVSLEYDPASSDAERLAHAKAWGDWAVARAGGPRLRPPCHSLDGRKLRVGYVSADFCQHTVGLFVEDVIREHDKGAFEIFAYSAGRVRDGVTDAIRAISQFRDVADLDDIALETLVRQDDIDVLVDLSGHTAGSRLTVFARRPAPVLVSWLGYFATTGLSCMDAVLLDEWHAPVGTEAFFVEPIVRLPGGRFCYRPADWVPAVAVSPPCTTRGYVTFGSFNNTAKYNAAVFDTWAQILHALPAARLILKWRTFQDEALRRLVCEAFAGRGIDPARLELRGASFHGDMLNEYADIDIALDPFPFTGGMTSCEALWMGVPVVTWPQSRVVSRQTLSVLSVVGLPELAAGTIDEYVQIAVGLAKDRARLILLRPTMRERMRTSTLLDARGFARQLETALRELYTRVAEGAVEDVREIY